VRLTCAVGTNKMEYFRIHVTYSRKTGKPVGIFGASHHLKRAEKSTPEEVKLFEDIDAWYRGLAILHRR